MEKSDFITKIRPEELKNTWLTSDTHFFHENTSVTSVSETLRSGTGVWSPEG